VPFFVALSAASLNSRRATLLPLIAEIDIWECHVEPSTLPECVVSILGLRVLKWGRFFSNMADVSSTRLTTLATCRAAFAHPARVADLVFKVDLFLDREVGFDEGMNEINWVVQGVRKEWQAERASLQAAGVCGSREFRQKIESRCCSVRGCSYSCSRHSTLDQSHDSPAAARA